MTSLLEVRDLSIFIRSEGRRLPILRDVSLSVDASETVAVVGETGSGKTITARAVMGILPKNAEVESGSITFEGTDMLSGKGATEARERLSMIFQNPMSSINPLFRVGEQMNDVLTWSFGEKGRGDAWRRGRVRSALEDAQCYDGGKILDMYPFQLSGGMRQRVMIAMALLRQPVLLIADEPTTALDVTTQREILELLKHLTDAEKMSLILITHNLGIARESSRRTYVMYAERASSSPSRRGLDPGGRLPARLAPRDTM